MKLVAHDSKLNYKPMCFLFKHELLIKETILFMHSCREQSELIRCGQIQH